MEDNFNIENCNPDDALSVKDKVFKIIQIQEGIKKVFCGDLSSVIYNSLNFCGIQIEPGGYLVGSKYYKQYQRWFTEGIDCEILKLGAKAWLPGKLRIKITLEFIPDQPEIAELESPLDDLRRLIQEES
ncbi:KGK domain protein [Fortiea sp. LEGE XX443]|uniref:KGK domain-containing protein n=1 Tax=Fortiea sp. LEGE XX443 TaxID=1828611 RepID=UPI00187F35A1|nr:KGK domain-containing protein [Fortiea sp. LEGE XX443]MBE9003596.1 KGK domain protein [Fortiea sp. LEGE XX443]